MAQATERPAQQHRLRASFSKERGGGAEKWGKTPEEALRAKCVFVQVCVCVCVCVCGCFEGTLFEVGSKGSQKESHTGQNPAPPKKPWNDSIPL